MVPGSDIIEDLRTSSVQGRINESDRGLACSETGLVDAVEDVGRKGSRQGSATNIVVLSLPDNEVILTHGRDIRETARLILL